MTTAGRRGSTGRGRHDREPLPKEVWVLVANSFLIAVGLGIVAPALPAFAVSFDVGVTAISFIISAFAVMRLAFAPTTGWLASRFGERPVFLIGMLVTALSTGAVAVAAEYWQLLAFRAFGGIGSVMYTVSSMTLLVRLVSPAQRGRASAMWATGFLMGNILGPLIGGVLLEVSLRLPFISYAVLAVVSATFTWLILRRSTLAAPQSADGPPAMAVRTAFRDRTYRATVAASLANGWVVFGLRMSLVPLFVIEVLDAGEGMSGVALAVFAIGNVAVLAISGRLADVFGRRPVALVGLLLLGSGTVWLGLAGVIWAFLIASFVTGMGTGALNPAMTAAVADVIGSERRGGKVMAAFQMGGDIGAIFGPLLAGVLADQVSYAAAFGLTGVVAAGAMWLWLRAPETAPARVAAASASTEPAGEPGKPGESGEPGEAGESYDSPRGTTA